MSVFLLTWNPKNFSVGGEGSDSGTLDYEIGQEVRWSCHSQQPQVGDTIYLIRVGLEPRGIVARGVVSKATYSAAHWSGSGKQKHYIDFQLIDLRVSCNEGLLPMMLLQSAMPDQKWSPQVSGIEIQQVYCEKLSDLWEGGVDKHSLEQFFTWYLTEQFDPHGWYKGYVETCNLTAQIQSGKEITKNDIKRLWFDSSNGIAGVGQGFMYQREFDANYDYLVNLTHEILNSPTEETYQKTLKEWKDSSGFERVLWGVIHRVFAAADPERYTSVVAQSYLNDVYKCLKYQYQLQSNHSGSWLDDNRALLALTKPYLDNTIDFQTRNILLWSLYEWKSVDKGNSSSAQEEEDNESSGGVSVIMKRSNVLQSLNQILYGPPGTGKTYHTLEAAVKAAEPDFYYGLEIDSEIGATAEQRNKLQDKFNVLSNSKRIRFVTFHQSYGYEEFVEGISASTLEGQVTYEVKPGIFKQICEQANRGVEQSNDPLEVAIDKLKSELEDGSPVSLATQTGKKFDVQYYGNTTFRAFPYETKHHDLGNGYPVSIDNIRKLYNGANPREFYNSTYVKAILEHIVATHNLPAVWERQSQESKQFVLVIDEINRGNISKIFGELITLIEDSKRSGKEQSETTEVILPHSGERFSVPSNLHIIGTMNTADRSLAMMDTALRRRFDFIEMMPKPELLEGVVIQGIELKTLLVKLNQRIEILYDREHTLGHAFFMPVKALSDVGEHDKAFTVLVSVFKNKIIPLLEEYFFEDWSKIRLVLADNQKPDHLQFVKEHEQKSDDLNALFGKGHNLDQYGQSVVKFTLAVGNDEVWNEPEAYIGIYQGMTALPNTDTTKNIG
ncbi:McrB family protein [Motilimonas pumila]|uniref:AAA family ATPase n=1 Tax=Motilimonas pumila TaxID=2303987 RepID=A0A418YA22_9GAMM|nr:AAA family ATPase [Motilimonas pumila]RJG38792.1 AAA family ATPase [Motilimonas pumila]